MVHRPGIDPVETMTVLNRPWPVPWKTFVFTVSSAFTHELRRYFRDPTIRPVNIKERQHLIRNGVQTMDVHLYAGVAVDRAIMWSRTPKCLQGLNNTCAA